MREYALLFHTLMALALLHIAGCGKDEGRRGSLGSTNPPAAAPTPTATPSGMKSDEGPPFGWAKGQDKE
jgi:hypothetical protein